MSRLLAPLSLVQALLHANQDVMGQQHQRHVVVPAAPRAHLIVVQPQFLFALLETGFDRPPHPQDAHEFDQWRVLRRIAQIILVGCWVELVTVTRGATDQQPAVGGG
jgi:hypothetical protein